MALSIGAGGEEKLTIVVGKEHDPDAFACLKVALASLGALPMARIWGVAGSQELSTWTVTLDGETLSIEAETYVGLSVTGARTQVARVAQALDRHGSTTVNAR